MVFFFNNYGFLSQNCGGWAKYIVDESGTKWPFGNYFYNLGTSVDGPLHYPMKLTDAYARWNYFLGKGVYEIGENVIDHLINHEPSDMELYLSP